MHTSTSLTTARHNPRARTPFDSPLTVNKIDPSDRFGFWVARLLWSEHWHGATLSVIDVLDERQLLVCTRWAVDILLRHMAPDGSGYPAGGERDLSSEALVILCGTGLGA